MNFKTLAASALLAATSLFSAVPAEAGQTWIHAATGDNGKMTWIQRRGCRGNICYAHSRRQGVSAMVVEEYNCKNYLNRFKLKDWNSFSNWNPALPGTVGEAMLEVACGYRS